MRKFSKTYAKHYVSRDPGTGSVEKESNGKPKLGRFMRNVTISKERADLLNKDWDNSELPNTFYYVEVVEEKKEDEKEYRKVLFEKVNKLVSDGKLEKRPANSIKTDDLITLINETEG